MLLTSFLGISLQDLFVVSSNITMVFHDQVSAVGHAAMLAAIKKYIPFMVKYLSCFRCKRKKEKEKTIVDQNNMNPSIPLTYCIKFILCFPDSFTLYFRKAWFSEAIQENQAEGSSTMEQNSRCFL